MHGVLEGAFTVMPILGWARVAGWVISVISFGCFVGKGRLLLLMMDCLSVHGASNGAFAVMPKLEWERFVG